MREWVGSPKDSVQRTPSMTAMMTWRVLYCWAASAWTMTRANTAIKAGRAMARRWIKNGTSRPSGELVAAGPESETLGGRRWFGPKI